MITVRDFAGNIADFGEWKAAFIEKGLLPDRWMRLYLRYERHHSRTHMNHGQIIIHRMDLGKDEERMQDEGRMQDERGMQVKSISCAKTGYELLIFVNLTGQQ